MNDWRWWQFVAAVLLSVLIWFVMFVIASATARAVFP